MCQSLPFEMPNKLSTLLLTIALTSPGAVAASEIDLRDYIKIDEGMSEAEVLYRLGPYDYETVYGFGFGYHGRLPTYKRWAYLPARGHNGWITEISFSYDGHVSRLERYRP